MMKELLRERRRTEVEKGRDRVVVGGGVTRGSSFRSSEMKGDPLFA